MNLVVNSGFEEGERWPNNWRIWSNPSEGGEKHFFREIEKENVYKGICSVKMSSDAFEQHYVVFQEFEVGDEEREGVLKAGATYKATVWVRTENLIPNPAGEGACGAFLQMSIPGVDWPSSRIVTNSQDWREIKFEETGREGTGSGHVWMRRFMVPGGEGYYTVYSQDKYRYNQEKKIYEQICGSNHKSHVRVEWATIDWQDQNKSGFKIDKVLRMFSEWQDIGLILETYDYAKGKGLVNWQHLECVERYVKKRPVRNDTTGRIFHCGFGQDEYVYIESFGSQTEPPIIYQYDLRAQKKGRRLEVIKLTSHWAKELGPQWYVVHRDLSKEGPLVKKMERVRHNYELPRWQGKRKKYLVDLPYAYTTPPKHLEGRYSRDLGLLEKKEKKGRARGERIPGLDKGIAISNETDTPDGKEKRFRLIGRWFDNLWCLPDPDAKAIWQPLIKKEARYRVEIWYTDDPHRDRASNAKFTVFHAEGQKTFVINMRENVKTWVPLDTFRFKPGWEGRVELSGDANGNLVANAVRFIKTD